MGTIFGDGQTWAMPIKKNDGTGKGGQCLLRKVLQALSEHRASTEQAPSKYVLGPYAQRRKNIHPNLVLDQSRI